MGTSAGVLSWIDDELGHLREEGLRTATPVLDGPMGAWVTIGGRRVLNLCANNYLGLANHPRLRAAAAAALDSHGVGTSAVRSIIGTSTLHVQLEEALAAFKQVEACLTLSSGFAANLATVPALVGPGDVVFSDRLNHASIIDACRLSRAAVVTYEHADADHLQGLLGTTRGEYRRALIVTDGVFSMDGDIAPLPALADLAEEHGCMLMVDDAHGEGVLGRGGRGIVDHFGLHGRVGVEVGTLSKAFGVVGGLVAGTAPLVEWLRQRARPHLFSSAMTAPDAAACREAVALLEESDDAVRRLWSNAAAMKTGLRELGLDLGATRTPIIPVMLGEAPLARMVSEELLARDVLAVPISYPTVPRSTARIRVMCSAAHSPDDIHHALEAFNDVGRLLGLTGRRGARGGPDQRASN